MNRLVKILVAGTLVLPATALAVEYEPAVVYSVQDVLGPQPSRSRAEFEPEVSNDGRFNHFRVRLHGVDSHVISNDWMKERLYEEEAIAVLQQIKESEAYQKGLDAALEAPLTLTRNTLNDPVATLESIPDGLSNLLQDIGSAISSAGSRQQQEDNAMLKDLIGFNTVKRRLAADLGVDVYSSNVLLQQEMDDVAWSMFAGGAVIDVALAAAPLVASLTVELSDQANTGSLSWNIPPATLQQAMARSIARHGLSEEDIKALVFHKTCSLTHLSSMVTNLTALGAVKGIDSFYQQVKQLDNELACRIHQRTAMLVYLYHINQLPLQRIDVYPHYVRLIDVNKKQVMVVVADYLAFRPDSELIFNSKKYANMMWLSGGLSEMARKQLGNEILVEDSVNERFKAPLDIVEVLMPERKRQPVAEGEETNRTREMVDGVTSGVTDVVGGVLGTLTSPLSGEPQQSEQQPAE